MKQIILSCIVAAIAGTEASAASAQWTVASGGNDHFYQAIAAPSGIDWLSAETAAEAQGGYLATITSTAENDFVFSLIGSSELWVTVGSGTRGPWLGGYQPVGSPEPLGGWAWVTGESFSFSNWAAGEPNNSGGTEDRIHFYAPESFSMANTWNDLNADGQTFAYIVESVPEPGTGALGGLSLILLALSRRGKRNASRAVKI